MFRYRRSLILTSLGLLIFLVYLAYSNPFGILMEIGRFNVHIFVIAVLVNYVGLFFFSASWYIILRILDIKISILESVQTMFISLFVVWMIPIPVGTEIIRAFMIKNRKNSGLGKAIASVVVHKAYYNIAFGVLLVIAVFMVSVLRGDVIPIQPGIVIFVIVFAIGSSMIYGLFLSPKLLKAVYEKSPHWVKRNIFDRLVNQKLQDKGFLSIIDEIDYSVSTITSNPFSSFLSILLVAFHWSTGSITSYFVALSLNQPIDFWVIVLIYAIIEFIQQLNIFIPGGLGIIDATLTGAFFVLGVPLSIASAISLLTRLATYWFEVFLCGIVSFRYGYRESLKEYMDKGLYR